MKHILVEIFVVLNSSFIVRKPFRKRSSFLWIFSANLRGYWVVRCGQSVRLCRSARPVDFGWIEMQLTRWWTKDWVADRWTRGWTRLSPEIILLHFYSHRVLQIWHFSKLFGQDHFRLKHGLQSVHVTSLWVESAGCLIRRGYFVLSTARIFVWIAPGFLSTRDTRKCIKRFPNRIPNPSLVVFYLRQIHNLLASDIFTTIGKS